MFETHNASPLVGTIIRTTSEDMLAGTYADEINRLLEERSALVFPRANLSPEEQLTFARTLGEIFLVGGKTLQKITLDSGVNPKADYLRGTFYWHIDGTKDDIPARATMLTARVLSDEGSGDTLVANTYAAYDALPEDDKRLIADLKVRHTLEATQRMLNPDPTYAELQVWQAYPAKSHPLVWTHRSGRKSLLIGATSHYVEGMGIEEGQALLCRLKEFATQDQFVYRHRWSVGDLLLFDNTGAMHKAAPYDLNSGRLLDRTTLCGEESVA
jgi:alpha-ketoglutarate-dependent taurine dioxygenase